MADPFRKVSDGDAFQPSAGLHNTLVEMVRWFRNQGGARGIGGRQATQQTGIIDCKNTSGGDLARFAALAIDSVFPDPSDNEVTFANGPILRGITPTASTDPGNFCVLLAPAKDDVIVRACISGVCQAKVNINDADDSTCGVGTTTVLQSGKQGAQILWKESGTGVKWAVIHLGSSVADFDRCTCQLTGALGTGDGTHSVDTVKPIRGSSPLNDPTSTAETLTVYNTHSWDGDNNASCDIRYNITTAHWEFDYVPCTA